MYIVTGGTSKLLRYYACVYTCTCTYIHVHTYHTYMCTCVQVGVPYRVHMVPVGTVFLLVHVVTVLVVCCGRQQHRFPGDSSSTAKRHLFPETLFLGSFIVKFFHFLDDLDGHVDPSLL